MDSKRLCVYLIDEPLIVSHLFPHFSPPSQGNMTSWTANACVCTSLTTLSHSITPADDAALLFDPSYHTSCPLQICAGEYDLMDSKRLCVYLIDHAVSRLELESNAPGVEQIVGIFDLRGFQVPRNADFVFAAFMVRLLVGFGRQRTDGCSGGDGGWIEGGWFASERTLGMLLCDAFYLRGFQVPRNADFLFAAFIVRMVVACEGSRPVMWLQRSAGASGFAYAAPMACAVDACGDIWGRELRFDGMCGGCLWGYLG